MPPRHHFNDLSSAGSAACSPRRPERKTKIACNIFMANIIPALRHDCFPGFHPFSPPGASYAIRRLQQAPSVTAVRAFACRLIHSRIKLTVFACCASESGIPCLTRHHFSMQPRQQQAVACIALNTGCPRTGVCLPSFAGTSAESFSRTKSTA